MHCEAATHSLSLSLLAQFFTMANPKTKWEKKKKRGKPDTPLFLARKKKTPRRNQSVRQNHGNDMVTSSGSRETPVRRFKQRERGQ
jgi:hypothetical protein